MQTFWGDWSFFQPDGENTFTAFSSMFTNPFPLERSDFIIPDFLCWLNSLDKNTHQKASIFQNFPGPLAAAGIIGLIFHKAWFRRTHFLYSGPPIWFNVPYSGNVNMFIGSSLFQILGQLLILMSGTVAFTLAVVASLGKLFLSVEAADKIDPDKQVTPTKRKAFCRRERNILSGI